jgi:hypothetical protein
VRWVVREYFKLALQSPCLFVEPITWTKSHKDAELIQRGYGPEEAKPARRVSAGPLSFSSSIHGGHTVSSLCPVSFLCPSLFLCVETLRSLYDSSTLSRLRAFALEPKYRLLMWRLMVRDTWPNHGVMNDP